MDNLMGGKPASSTTTQTASVPAWLDKENQSLVSRAVTESNKSYVPYTGERVAQFGPEFEQAKTMYRDLPGMIQPLMGSASQSALDYASRAGKTPTAEDYSSRMNPYLRSVLDPQLRKLSETYGAELAATKRNRAMTDSFGGSRGALGEALQKERFGQQVADVEGQGMFDAWNQAQNQYNNEMNQLQTAAGLGGTTAQQIADAQSAAAQGLTTTADSERTLEQAGLDTQYQQFLEEQGFGKEQLAFLAQILNPQSNIYRVETGTQTGTKGGGSKAGDIIGTGLKIASMIPWSDERLKENIEKVGKLDNGLPVYKYNFKGSPTTEIGVLAQEAEKKSPRAVGEFFGYKAVDYDVATAPNKSGNKTRGYADG